MRATYLWGLALSALAATAQVAFGPGNTPSLSGPLSEVS